MSARGRPLSHEDRVLWGRIARSVTPLKGRAAAEEEEEVRAGERQAAKEPVTGSSVAPVPAARRPDPARQHPIDGQTREKLKKGRLPIEGKVDLHGLTQSEAHGLLLGFLHRAHADGRRHVLVVTGKGASLGSEGALRRAVPAWLATPPFRPLVGGYEEAARNHGGAGALYVRLRRRAEG